MNKQTLVLIVLGIAAPSWSAVPKKDYGQCQELYGKAAFAAEDRVKLEDAAKNGPCVGGVGAGATTFVPSIDRKTGEVSMIETRSKEELDAAIARFRSDSYVFSKHVNAKDTRKAVAQMRTEARSWMGWAPAKNTGYEVFGSPVAGPVVARHGEPVMDRGPLPLYPNAPRNPPEAVLQVGYAPVAIVGRGAGAIGHGIDRGSQQLMNTATYNLDHLPPDPRAVVVAPVSVGAVFVSGVGQLFGKIVGGIGDAVGYAPYDAARAERQAAPRRITRADAIAQRDAWMYNRDRSY